MLALFSFLTVLVLSIILTKIGTAALIQTGVSKQMARFQARSALTGTGFTTSESDGVVTHPVRRQIISTLMILGSAGVVTSVSSLILTFAQQDQAGDFTATTKALIILAGLVILWALASNRWFDHLMHHLVAWAFRRFTKLDARDYASLLHLAENFIVSELGVKKGDWLCDQTIADTHLDREGLVVLGIERRDGSYVGIPSGETHVCDGDTVVIYGTEEAIRSLDARGKGDRGSLARLEALARETERAARQRKLDQSGDESGKKEKDRKIDHIPPRLREISSARSHLDIG